MQKGSWQEQNTQTQELIELRDTLFYGHGSVRFDVLKQIFRQLLNKQDLNHVVYGALARHLSVALRKTEEQFSDHSDELYDKIIKVDFALIVQEWHKENAALLKKQAEDREELKQKSQDDNKQIELELARQKEAQDTKAAEEL